MPETSVKSRIVLLSATDSPEKSSGNERLSRPKRIQTRVLNLDVLRGVAILLVLFSHQVFMPNPGSFKDFIVGLHPVGQGGVDLFFVLSGFLVGGLLLTEVHQSGQIDVRRFLIRRAFKIWPPYFALLIVTGIQLVRHDGYTFQTMLQKLTPFVFSLQNYVGPWDIITQTWSLAVEEHFYVALPIVLLCLSRRKSERFSIWRSLPVVAIGLLVFCNVFKVVGCVTGAFPVNGFNTHVRMDALFIGVLLNYLHTYCKPFMGPVKNQSQLVFASGILLVVLRYCLPATPLLRVMSWTLLYLGYGLCLLAVMNLTEGSLIDRVMKSHLSKFVAWIGLYSYSIYLWHFAFAGPFVISKVIPFLPNAFKCPLGMSIYLVLAILNGVIFARLIDLPVLAFRNKFFPSRTA